MGLLTTKSCCFCLSLRTGGLVLGYLVVLSSILHTLDLSYKYYRHTSMIHRGYNSYGEEHEYHLSVIKSERIYYAVTVGTNCTTFSHSVLLFKQIYYSKYSLIFSDLSICFARIDCLAVWYLQGKQLNLFLKWAFVIAIISKSNKTLTKVI